MNKTFRFRKFLWWSWWQEIAQNPTYQLGISLQSDINRNPKWFWLREQRKP